MEEDKSLCIVLKELISDEREASPKYRELVNTLREKKELTREDQQELNKIISDEESHERYLLDLAQRLECKISTKQPTRKLYSDLSLRERIKLARSAVARME